MSEQQPDIRAALDILLEALANDTVPHCLYYLTHETVEQSKAYLWPAHEGLPDVFLLHPDDVDLVRAELPRYITLTPFSDWRPR
jgi:hypothetical protein